MTEAEFNQQQNLGQVQVVTSQADNQAPNQPTSPKTEVFDPTPFLLPLEQIRAPRKHLTNAPAFVPQNFAEQIQLIDDGTKRVAVYVNGQWIELAANNAWSLVEHAEFSGVSSLTISSLTGDTDKIYRLIVKGYFNTAETLLHLRFNGDTGTNYHYSLHRQGLVSDADNHSQTSSGSLVNNKEAYAPLYDGSCKRFLFEMLIDAKSGFVRKAQGKLTTYTDKDTWFQSEFLGIWTNTADEVTSISITAGQNFLTGSEYWLYKA